MADNNIIKPVEVLQNIGALTGAQQRNKRKPKQGLNKKNDEESNPDESALNQLADEQDLNNEIAENEKKLTEDKENGDSDSVGIDYCA